LKKIFKQSRSTKHPSSNIFQKSLCQNNNNRANKAHVNALKILLVEHNQTNTT